MQVGLLEVLLAYACDCGCCAVAVVAVVVTAVIAVVAVVVVAVLCHLLVHDARCALNSRQLCLECNMAGADGCSWTFLQRC